MIRRNLLLLSAGALLWALPVLAQPQQTLLNFTGYDYEDPNGGGPPGAHAPVLDGGTYLDVGDGYKSLGFITSVGPLLEPYVDFGISEYTYYLFGLTVTARFFDGDNLFCQFNNGGRVQYFEDPFARPSTPATYGINPPNATAPSTFTDPLPPALGGSLDNFGLLYTNSTGQGSWSGQMTLDEGSYLIYVPAPQRSGWILGATAGPPNPSIPTGYDHQVEGNCIVPGPTPTEHRTWGAIKSLYR